MDNFPKAARKSIVDDLNIQLKSMFIDMDLAKHRVANSPRGPRRQQKSADSHDEFEFSIFNMGTEDDVYETAMEVASADKLFFKGQLLPLQKDLKLEEVKAEEDSCEKLIPFAQHCASLLNFQYPQERCSPLAKLEDPHKKCASEKSSLMICDSDDSFTRHCISQASTNTQKNHAHEEGLASEFPLRDGSDLIRSCRFDRAFDFVKSDSCSSSFRSHQSSHWSSGEKDSRNSSSSSRYSNGSCQDSCLQQADRKALHVSTLRAKHANTHLSKENECDMHATSRNADLNQRRTSSDKMPMPTLHSRKWSWKGIFTGLKKASKLWADSDRADEGQVPSKAGVPKKPLFTLKELSCASMDPASYDRWSIGHDWDWQTKTHRFVSSERSSKPGKLSVGRDDYTKETQIGTIFCLGSKEASFHGDAGDCRKKEKGKVQGNIWNAKKSWNRCVSKIRRGTRLSSASKGQQKQIFSMHMSNKNKAILMGELEEKGDHVYRGMKAKSLSSTPLAKSPVRRSEYISVNPSHRAGANIAPSSSSSMNNVSKKVGFASCPASMRSSPHHSGRLPAMSKATPDLHIAIQGAIAHCKQSQGS